MVAGEVGNGYEGVKSIGVERGCVDLEREKDPLGKEAFCSSSGARCFWAEGGLVVVRGNIWREMSKSGFWGRKRKPEILWDWWIEWVDAKVNQVGACLL